MDAERSRGEPFRLLFVCTGNTCRSPMAEAIARSKLTDLGWSHVDVASAGTGAWGGGGASAGAVRAAARHGLDLTSHRASPLRPEDAARADLILAMSPAHLAAVGEVGAAGKAELLVAFAGGGPEAGGPSVPDPFGGADEEYEATFLLLERLIDGALRRLAPILAP